MSKELQQPTGGTTGDWKLRVLLVIVGLGLWFGTQYLISERKVTYEIGDRLLEWTTPVHDWLNTHKMAADVLLVVSSTLINILAIFLLAWSIFGPSVRPFLGLLMLFALRQVCQGLCALPAPHEMIWRYPEFCGWKVPGLLVTYGVSNDLFFSGHTAMAVYGAVELARLKRWWLRIAALAIALFEIATVIVLRAHWTMDVFTGALAALLAAELAARWSPRLDRRLAAIWPNKSTNPPPA